MKQPRDEATDYHSEISDRNTNIIWCHLYVESKKMVKTHFLQNRTRVIDVQNKLIVSRGESGEVGRYIGRLGLTNTQ